MAEKITVAELSQKLQISLLQLTASLVVIHGEGLESFDSLSNEIRDAYLWGLADRARECERMAAKLDSELVGNNSKVRHG